MIKCKVCFLESNCPNILEEKALYVCIHYLFLLPNNYIRVQVKFILYCFLVQIFYHDVLYTILFESKRQLFHYKSRDVINIVVYVVSIELVRSKCVQQAAQLRKATLFYYFLLLGFKSQINEKLSKGSQTSDMTSEGLWETFEGDSADMCTGKFQVEGLACVDPVARTPISVSQN
jgi:hypothetical protein